MPIVGNVYRFALRPLWILSHLFVVALVVAMVNFGFWQLRRLGEKRDANEAILARQDAAALDVSGLFPGWEGDAGDLPEQSAAHLEYSPVEARGRFDSEGEVLVRNRSNGGSPGYWVLTPLILDGGVGVVVNRGWVPLALGDKGLPIKDAAAPDTSVRIEGWLAPTQERGSIGPTDPADGRLAVLSRVDVGRLGSQLEYPLLPMYLNLVVQDPPGAGPYPTRVEVPGPSEGPHLSYAIQWFTFSTIAALGYPMILRKVARERSTRPDQAKHAA